MAAGRIGSIAFIAGGWILFGVRIVLELIGYATIPEDTEVARTRIEALLTWLSGVPSWLVFGFVLIPTIVLIYVSWPKNNRTEIAPRRSHVAPSEGPVVTPQSETYSPAHETLMRFTTRHLLPTCNLLFRLQEAAIRSLCTNGIISNAAVEGAKPRGFTEHVSRLSGLANSPPDFIPFKDMASCVEMIEKNYGGIPRQIQLILQQSAVSVEEFLEKNSDLYKTWQSHHHDMVFAYESIKCDPNMGQLFRPVRPARWQLDHIPLS